MYYLIVKTNGETIHATFNKSMRDKLYEIKYAVREDHEQYLCVDFDPNKLSIYAI